MLTLMDRYIITMSEEELDMAPFINRTKAISRLSFDGAS
jgi:hypothetical protein